LQPEETERIRHLLQTGQRSEARLNLQAILRLNPQDVQAWLLLAESMNDNERRGLVLQRALHYNPNSQELHTAIEELNALTAEARSPWQKAQPRLMALVAVLVIAALLAGALRLPDLFRREAAPTAQPGQAQLLPAPGKPAATTRPHCSCSEAQAYLEHTLYRIQGLHVEIRQMEQDVQRLDLSASDYETYAQLAKERNDAQRLEDPPPCMEEFQRKTVSVFYNWWQGMQALSAGEQDNARFSLSVFAQRQAELYDEAIRLNQKLNCRPSQRDRFF